MATKHDVAQIAHQAQEQRLAGDTVHSHVRGECVRVIGVDLVQDDRPLGKAEQSDKHMPSGENSP